MKITIKRLSSGYYRVQGNGCCEWAQPPHWPCDEATLREYAAPEASETFIAYAMERSAEDRLCQAEEAAERRAEDRLYHNGGDQCL